MDHKMSIVNMGWDSLCPALYVILQQKSSLFTDCKGANEYEGVLCGQPSCFSWKEDGEVSILLAAYPCELVKSFK